MTSPPTPIAAPSRPSSADYLSLAARILLSALFLWSGANKILHPDRAQAFMAAHGMPFPELFLPAAIALELGSGLSVLLGIYAQEGAGALAVFTLLTAFIFHSDFRQPLDQVMFLKNLAITGGLLMIVQHGAGRLVLRWPQAAPKSDP